MSFLIPIMNSIEPGLQIAEDKTMYMNLHLVREKFW